MTFMAKVVLPNKLVRLGSNVFVLEKSALKINHSRRPLELEDPSLIDLLKLDNDKHHAI